LLPLPVQQDVHVVGLSLLEGAVDQFVRGRFGALV
jgi:hypothetical protein